MSNPPSAEDIDAYIDQLVPQISLILSQMVGSNIKIPKGATKEVLIPFLQFVAKWQEDIKAADEREKKRLANEFFRKALELSGERPTGSPIDSWITHMAAVFENPKGSYLNGTRFDKYKDALFQIINEGFTTGKIEDVKKFLESIPSEEIYSTFQNAIRLNKELEILKIEPKRITSKKLQEYITLYDHLTGYMELTARLLRGIRAIYGNEAVRYEHLAKDNLANHIGTLKSAANFSELISPLNVTIRNAIAHKSVRIDPIKKQIIFRDRQSTVPLSYQDFCQQTRELAAAMIITSHLSDAITLGSLHGIKKAIFPN